jgi:hypothetical protein
MPRRLDSSFTMFVYLRGHHLLEYYFAVSDTGAAANDSCMDAHSAVMSAAPAENMLALENSACDWAAWD